MTIHGRRAASVAKLCTLKDVTPELAEQIRKVWQTEPFRHVARAKIDKLFGAFGVEYLGQHRRSGEHIDYCNAGDVYANTIIFHGPNMQVGCVGDLVERNLIKESSDGF
jgi:hypothetical protein